MVLEGKDLALLVRVAAGIPIVDCSRRGVGEAAAASACLYYPRAWPGSNALKDVTVVGSVDDLRSVRQATRPQLGAGPQEIDESTRCGHCFCQALLTRLVVGFVLARHGRALALHVLPSSLAPSRSRVDER